MLKRLFKNYVSFVLILTVCTVFFAGCQNKKDDMTANLNRIIAASIEFSKVKNGRLLFSSNQSSNDRFEKTIEFIKKGDDIDWLLTGPYLKTSKYVEGRAYVKDEMQWSEVPKDSVPWSYESDPFVQMAQNDLNNNLAKTLYIKVNRINRVTEYEVHYNTKEFAKESYENAYENFIIENPWLTNEEISDMWDSIAPTDFEIDSLIIKYGIDENNVLIYIDTYESDGETTINKKAELVEYNIENFNPFK